jgi:hypothetical protein
VHQGALVNGEARPDADVAARVAVRTDAIQGSRIALPATDHSTSSQDLGDVCRLRSSSFGGFESSLGLSLEDLAGVLDSAARGQTWPSDLKPEGRTVRFTRMVVFANHVHRLRQGIYDYDQEACALVSRHDGDCSFELQSRYFLQNYNLEQAAAGIVIVGPVQRMLHAYGNRGIRVLNAEVGLVAQHIYMACAGRRTGCGALLGFDNVAINELAGIGGDETSLLLLMVGPQVVKPVAFDYRIGW